VNDPLLIDLIVILGNTTALFALLWRDSASDSEKNFDMWIKTRIEADRKDALAQSYLARLRKFGLEEVE
jgi:hypothetical protein